MNLGAQMGPVSITKLSPNWACQMGPIHCPKFLLTGEGPRHERPPGCGRGSNWARPCMISYMKLYDIWSVTDVVGACPTFPLVPPFIVSAIMPVSFTRLDVRYACTSTCSLCKCMKS